MVLPKQERPKSAADAKFGSGKYRRKIRKKELRAH